MSRIVINVTKDGDRFFSTNRAALGAADTAKATEIVVGLRAGFPESEGYKVEAIYIAQTVAEVSDITLSLLAMTTEG